jgi:hypothetical protein
VEDASSGASEGESQWMLSEKLSCCMVEDEENSNCAQVTIRLRVADLVVANLEDGPASLRAVERPSRSVSEENKRSALGREVTGRMKTRQVIR